MKTEFTVTEQLEAVILTQHIINSSTFLGRGAEDVVAAGRVIQGLKQELIKVIGEQHGSEENTAESIEG